MLRASVVALMLMINPAVSKELSGLDAAIAGFMNGPGPSADIGETGTPKVRGSRLHSGTLGIQTSRQPYMTWEQYKAIAESINDPEAISPDDIAPGLDDEGRYYTVNGHVFDPYWTPPDDQGYPHYGPCIQDYCWVVVDYDDEIDPEDGTVGGPVVWSLLAGPLPYDYGLEPPAPPEDDSEDDEPDLSDCANDAC